LIFRINNLVKRRTICLLAYKQRRSCPSLIVVHQVIHRICG